MSSLTNRSVRLATGAVAALLLSVPLAACDLSSQDVSCSGKSCTATLSGDGAKVSILGTQVAFVGTQNGRASLSVGDATASCTQGEKVSAGPLALTCTTVTDKSVQLTASLG
jgi:hypothetical protein